MALRTAVHIDCAETAGETALLEMLAVVIIGMHCVSVCPYLTRTACPYLTRTVYPYLTLTEYQYLIRTVYPYRIRGSPKGWGYNHTVTK